MDEINVMKRVSDGNNPHVLKMLGCVTTTNPMMLVLQFVPHGNLKDYLRAMKTMEDVRDVIVREVMILDANFEEYVVIHCHSTATHMYNVYYTVTMHDISIVLSKYL